MSDGLLVFEVRSCRAGKLSTFYILYPHTHSRSDGLLLFEVRSFRAGMLSTFYILYTHAHSRSDGMLAFEVRSCRPGMLSTFYILYPHTPSRSDGLLAFEVRSCRAAMLSTYYILYTHAHSRQMACWHSTYEAVKLECCPHSISCTPTPIQDQVAVRLSNPFVVELFPCPLLRNNQTQSTFVVFSELTNKEKMSRRRAKVKSDPELCREENNLWRKDNLAD